MAEERARAAHYLWRVAILLAAGAAALSLSACFLGAAQMYPLMVEGAETTASEMIQTTASILRVTESPSPYDPNHPDADSLSGCGELKHEPPGLIELRMSAAGTPEYRELRPDTTLDPVRWIPIADDDTGTEGWRPAVNFLQMEFNPPIAAAVPPAASVYMAYAPQKNESWSQQDHRASLSTFFGPPTGTFNWNKRPYEYVLVKTVPCFPLPE
ncbi:MAG: hypothetical protein ACYDC3_07260 [Candidatus Binataceae bacterium]